jgi:transposase
MNTNTSVVFPSRSRVGGLFPPQDPERAELLDQLHQCPDPKGISGSRWTLERIGRECPVMRTLTTVGGICRRLQKWQIARKQGRLDITSPDPAYQSKIDRVQQAFSEAQSDPKQTRLLYADELTFYRQATLSPCYHEQGRTQPHSDWTGGYNTKYRIGATLDALTAEVVAVWGSKVGVEALAELMQKVRQHYGPTTKLSIAWDNWPVHEHEDVVRAAKDQNIDLLFLPTYAPWTNPIEKLWRMLKQVLLRMHPDTSKERWPLLRQKVRTFLEQFARPSPELLKYVGLDKQTS